MQIYLHQNNQQEGPFTLPRISARLVSGDLDSATLAWHEGLDNWYPLSHEKWQALGIVAPPPKEKAPVTQSAPVEDRKEGESVLDSSAELEADVKDSLDELPVEESNEPSPVAEEEPTGPSFASYREEDFKPPSFEEMEKQMIELRTKRAGLPEAIGRRAHEINFRDEEIEDAWEGVEKALESGTGEDMAFASLGQAVLSAGLNDPGLEEIRDEEREVADRMLNLQMQLRRMGGGKRVKKGSSWMKWVFLGFVVLLLGGVTAAVILAG
ncbi:MAG: DUF4339 domain-containing protein [Opitutae bacterium]|jgi:hypothetical protein|nr:DUF4339 domain-containing protein [Opitutae bacterium]